MADIRFTSLLDDFSWAAVSAEDPISHGGKWANVDGFASGLWSNGVNPTINAHSFSWSYWTAGPFSGDKPIEVWAYPIGGQFGAAGEGWRLGMWMDVGGTNQADGYAFGWFNALGSTTIHRRYTNTSPTDIGTEVANDAVWDSIMLLQRDPNGDFRYYLSIDNGASWILQVSANDTTYTGPFYIACMGEDPTGGGLGYSGFGGGGPVTFIPQIYRRIYTTPRSIRI